MPAGRAALSPEAVLVEAEEGAVAGAVPCWPAQAMLPTASAITV
jgi:hypothetical protein